MSYRVALEKLLAYEPKRLVRGWYELGTGSCCVVGAIVYHSRRFGTRGIEAVFVDRDAFMEIQSLGLTCAEAAAMQDANDSFRGHLHGCPSEDRYRHMVEWLRRRVAEERA